MAQGLIGRVALVTGAARGQGRSHALRLAEEGAHVIAVDICAPIAGVAYPAATEQDLQETVALVTQAGGRIEASVVDVRDLASLRDAVAQGVAKFGRLDVVAANAGIATTGLSHELSPQLWQDMININLTGVWKTCTAAIPHIVAGGRGGSIVLTSSVQGARGGALLSHYAAAKHGLIGLMQSLANELGPHMIRVNTVQPTNAATDMFLNQGLFDMFRPDLEHPTIEDAKPVSQGVMVMPKPWVEAIDVSNALVFLASDQARYITGATIPIDLGQLVAM